MSTTVKVMSTITLATCVNSSLLSDRNKKERRGGETHKADEGIADMEMEEEKRSLIHREIDKFRDTYKVRSGERC